MNPIRFDVLGAKFSEREYVYTSSAAVALKSLQTVKILECLSAENSINSLVLFLLVKGFQLKEDSASDE